MDLTPVRGRPLFLEPSCYKLFLTRTLQLEVDFLTFDFICRPTNLFAIEVCPVPSKELWTDFAIIVIGCVPALTAVCVIFFCF
jgi:hypothetical protein